MGWKAAGGAWGGTAALAEGQAVEGLQAVEMGTEATVEEEAQEAAAKSTEEPCSCGRARCQ